MQRAIEIGLAFAAVFALVLGVALKLMPGPLKNSDYLMIGSVATLLGMLAVFLVVVSRTGNPLFKKRKKQR